MDQQQPGQTTNPSSTSTPGTVTGSDGGAQSHSILSDLLKTLGVGQDHIDAVHNAATSSDATQQLDKAHSYITDVINQARQQAQKNPGAVLGGLSALIIAAGMMKSHMGGR